MAHKIRKFHKQSLELYEQAFGKKLNNENFMIRRTHTGVVIIKALLSDNNIFHIIDQVLVVNKKIYRNSELVFDGGEDGGS